MLFLLVDTLGVLPTFLRCGSRRHHFFYCRSRFCLAPGRPTPNHIFFAFPIPIASKGGGGVRAAAADQAPDQHPEGGGHPVVRLLGAVRRAVRPDYLENREEAAGPPFFVDATRMFAHQKKELSTAKKGLCLEGGLFSPGVGCESGYVL